MTLRDYKTVNPEAGEGILEYCRRLEADGHEEMFIRKALSHHFAFDGDEHADFFEQLELARLRHLTLLMHIHPNRSTYSLTMKIAKNLGLSKNRADYWVRRFHEVGEVDYIGMEEFSEK